MMSYSHTFQPMFSYELFKPRVAQTTSCHFYAFTRLCSLALRIKMFHIEWYVLFITQMTHKGLITITFFTAQVEVTVRSRPYPALFGQGTKAAR